MKISASRFSHHRWLLSLLLLLFAAPVFADKLPLPNFTPPPTDLSMLYLGQLFGTVGNVTTSTSGQMLGRMIEILNDGILGFVALYLGFTVVTIFIKAANVGSFQNANKDVAILLLRIALGVGLLLPNPATGYTIMQDIVMRVVSAGVALADDTWNRALTYLDNGGILYNTQRRGAVYQSYMIQKLASNLTGFGLPPARIVQANDQYMARSKGLAATPSSLALMRTIFMNEVCMYRSEWAENHTNNNPTTNNTNANSNLYVSAASKKTYSYEPEIGENTNQIYFPGYGDPSSNNEPQGHYGSACGYVGLNGGVITAATKKMVEDELPIARAYVNTLTDHAAAKSIQTEAGQSFSRAILMFYNIVQSYNYPTSQSIYDRLFIKNASAQGWMMAGRYYWDLERLNADQASSQDVSQLIPSGVGFSSSIPKSVQNDVAAAGANFDVWYAPNTYFYNLIPYLESLGITDINNYQTGSYHASNSNKILSAALNVFDNIFAAFSLPVQNPIAFLIGIGKACLHTVNQLFDAAFGLAVTMAASMGLCNSTDSSGKVWSAISNWAQNFVLLLMSVIAVPGVVLAFYVPLYPFILFTFSTIGWMILVLESMVAAPLVCYGLTHPDNHDFLGRAEQAVMLLLSVFLRPVLLVIGLVAGIILSYVSLRLVIFGFQGILNDLWLGDTLNITGSSIVSTASKAAYGFGSISSLLGFLALLMIFGGLVYTLVQQAFSVVYLLPNAIMKWIGAPAAQDDSPAQLARQIQSFASAPGGKATDITKNYSSAVGNTSGRIAGTGVAAARGAAEAPEGQGARGARAAISGYWGGEKK